jgi:hypothetical protein
MNRLNVTLTTLLIVQLVIAALVLLPRTTAPAGEVEALFLDLDAERIVALTISGSDGRSLRLEYDNGSWVVAGTDGYPTLENQVPELLAKIVAFNDARMVTETTASHKRLGVDQDEYERLVEFELEDGSRNRFFIGTSPSFGAVHLRVDGEDEVYLISDLSTQDVGVEAADWVDRSYLSVPRDEVTALTLENASGMLSFAKEGDMWTMQGMSGDEVLNETALQSLLTRATNVSLVEPLGKTADADYGLQAPLAVVVLTAGEKRYELTVGAYDSEDGSYVMASSESPYYVRAQESAVQDLVEKIRTDFLQQPTPVPEATPSE